MKKLKLLISVFCICVSFPLAFVIWQTYNSLEQEEKAQMRFFAEKLFEQMELELATIIQTEESREVDEYGYFLAPDKAGTTRRSAVSPLADGKYPSFILGYLQNNPNGSFQTPFAADAGSIPPDRVDRFLQLKAVNQFFNEKKMNTILPLPLKQKEDSKEEEQVEGSKSSISERYLRKGKQEEVQEYLGKKRQRIEQITPEQAYNIASEKDALSMAPQKVQSDKQPTISPTSPSSTYQSRSDLGDNPYGASIDQEIVADIQDQDFNESSLIENGARFQVEVAPFQSVAIENERIYVFRRINMNNQMYRQGFVLDLPLLFQHLAESHFSNQPLAKFSSLQLTGEVQGFQSVTFREGTAVTEHRFSLQRTFPEPFRFLSVRLVADTIPRSPARNSLNIAILLLTLFLLSGLFVIYRSVHSIVALSERRQQFVSTVTHELKTPLTNIRMYVEMLQNNIAPTPEKEDEYLDILSSESSRLSGLINNVLELARLEKKTRQFNYQQEKFNGVLNEVETIMSAKARQEGFIISINPCEISPFFFDREVVVQILVNLIENSMKFGKNSPNKQISIQAQLQDKYVCVSVSDTGPGIPETDLSKVFDDFYRVDNSLTRSTGGTGIGLSLVKRFITAMNGKVWAENNSISGCTVFFLLPYFEKMVDGKNESPI